MFQVYHWPPKLCCDPVHAALSVETDDAGMGPWSSLFSVLWHLDPCQGSKAVQAAVSNSLSNIALCIGCLCWSFRNMNCKKACLSETPPLPLCTSRLSLLSIKCDAGGCVGERERRVPLLFLAGWGSLGSLAYGKSALGKCWTQAFHYAGLLKNTTHTQKLVFSSIQDGASIDCIHSPGKSHSKDNSTPTEYYIKDCVALSFMTYFHTPVLFSHSAISSSRSSQLY